MTHELPLLARGACGLISFGFANCRVVGRVTHDMIYTSVKRPSSIDLPARERVPQGLSSTELLVHYYTTDTLTSGAYIGAETPTTRVQLHPDFQIQIRHASNAHIFLPPAACRYPALISNTSICGASYVALEAGTFTASLRLHR